jgi:hypothetical protein
MACAAKPTRPPTSIPERAKAPVEVEAEPEPLPAPESKPVVAEPAPPEEPPLQLTSEELARAKKVQRHVRDAAAEYSLDPNLLNGIIWVSPLRTAPDHSRRS